MDPTPQPADILLVEDSPSDALLTEEALKASQLFHRLHVVNDGVRAISFLRRQTPYQDAPRPRLILLDLNMPRMNGREVLAEIKNDDILRTIPVIVLTTSSAETDVLQSYNLHANSYIVKPVDFGALVEALAGISRFWFSLVTLPPNR